MVVLAGLGGLKERELELSKGVARLLSLRRDPRNSPVRGIDDE
jgi:hypothetical protein